MTDKDSDKTKKKTATDDTKSSDGETTKSSDSGESSTDSDAGANYSPGERQKPVSKAYRDGWDRVFNKKSGKNPRA